MASLRSLLIRLLAALLFLQSGVAAAHCLKGISAGEGVLIEICSTDGLRTIRVDATGEPAPEEPGNNGGAFCPVCHGLPAINLPEPALVAEPAWVPASIAWHAQGTELLRLPARASPYSTRAPPITA